MKLKIGQVFYIVEKLFYFEASLRENLHEKTLITFIQYAF